MAKIVFADTGKSIKVSFGTKEGSYGFKEIEIAKNSTPLTVEEDNIHLSFYSNGNRVSVNFNDVDEPSSENASVLRNKLSHFFFSVSKVKIINNSYLGFNGDDEYLDMSANISQVEGNNVGTINVWHKATAGGMIFSMTDGTSSNDRMIFRYGASTGSFENETLQFKVRRNGVNVYDTFYLAGSTILDDNTWRMLTYRINGSDNAFFIDGLKKSASFLTGGLGTSEFSNLNNADIILWGARKLTGSVTLHHTGGLNMGSIYSAGLTDAQILELYARGDRTLDPRTLDSAKDIIELWQMGSGDKHDGTKFNVVGLVNNLDGVSVNMESNNKIIM